MSHLSKHIAFLIACLLSVMLCAQTGLDRPIVLHEHQLDNAAYDSLYQEIAYDQTKTALRTKRPTKPKEPEENKAPEGMIKFGGTGFQILGYVMVLALIGGIIYLILSKIKIDPGESDKGGFEKMDIDDIEDIDMIDADAGLQRALAEGDYRMAFAWHYIKVLQHLSSTGRIDWEPSKTNRDYIREMRADRDNIAFSDVSRWYDMTLYGDRPLGESQYIALLPPLNLLTSETSIPAHE